MARNAREALAEGLADALGFVGGALGGWQLGRALGFDVLAPGPMDTHALVGWLFLLAGCGAGKLMSRRWARQWLTGANDPTHKP